MIAVLAPGQGAQTPGMLDAWLHGPRAEQVGAEAMLARWSEAAGLDLARLGTTASAEEIKDTAVTQPLIVAASLLAHAQLGAALTDSSALAKAPSAGHSIGELAAAAVAGALSSDAAVELAAVRGREMAAACALQPTGMSAVLGGDAEQVFTRLGEIGLDPANQNGTGQVVAAGPLDALARLKEEPPEKARVIPLAVAGAFHTRFMSPAEDALRDYAEKVDFADPDRPLLSNADGASVTSGGDLRDRLVAQVTLAVRWDLCMAMLRELGVTAVIELAPAGTLVGLVKRELKGTATLALKSPDDLDKAAELVAEHAGSAA
ncbi:MAG TPA: ACP S-malonyltransferase [Pseudonocardia sp.]|uniref:ACP S-malonyltransferase n=1 Tax=Pseudonocardia sp. TaxID=60912 RepID=UPI002F41CF41